MSIENLFSGEYNHNRPIESFHEDIDVIKKHGFNPIAVSQMFFEDTFVFETAEESERAYAELECGDGDFPVGWWYGKEDFIKAVTEFEKDAGCKVRTYWLNDIE